MRSAQPAVPVLRAQVQHAQLQQHPDAAGLPGPTALVLGRLAAVGQTGNHQDQRQSWAQNVQAAAAVAAAAASATLVVWAAQVGQRHLSAVIWTHWAVLHLQQMVPHTPVPVLVLAAPVPCRLHGHHHPHRRRRSHLRQRQEHEAQNCTATKE